MYRAKNGFTLQDETAPGGGWKIQNANDIITALLVYPEFATVDTGILWEAIGQAVDDRKEYASIDDLAAYLTANYI